MPDQKQLEKVWLFSDTVLYPEAVTFIRRLVHEQRCNPLPASQVTGLLNIAQRVSYAHLEEFIVHQRERNWPPGKRDIKIFYTELYNTLTEMRDTRLKQFHLLDGVKPWQEAEEKDALMALVAREFIQHVVAENGVLNAEIV